MFKIIFKAIISDCSVLYTYNAQTISLVSIIYARPLRLIENWSTHPKQRMQKRMTHHFSVPGTAPSTYGQSLKYIGILNIAVFYTY